MNSSRFWEVMMKKLILLTMAIALVGCASSEKGSRGIASVDANHCSLKKHPSKNYYKIMYKGNELYKHWYDSEYATDLLQRSEKKGKCL